MKAVLAEVPQTLLDWRRRTGADIWDEMWEGVLHMPPAPDPGHQDFQADLVTWLRVYWQRPRGNKVFPTVNLAPVGGWPDDYRIPDLILLTPDRLHIQRKAYFEGAPLAVVEIRSPGDETMEKLPFYARLGVVEVWVIDRDTKIPQLYRLEGGRYQLQQPAAEGWLHSAAGILLRAEPDNRLTIQLADDPSTGRLLPEG